MFVFSLPHSLSFTRGSAGTWKHTTHNTHTTHTHTHTRGPRRLILLQGSESVYLSPPELLGTPCRPPLPPALERIIRFITNPSPSPFYGTLAPSPSRLMPDTPNAVQRPPGYSPATGTQEQDRSSHVAQLHANPGSSQALPGPRFMVLLAVAHPSLQPLNSTHGSAGRAAGYCWLLQRMEWPHACPIAPHRLPPQPD